jgi:uncharacterized RDD family membrane protein YckC
VKSSDVPAPENQPTTPTPPDYSIERDLGLAVKICPGCRTSNLPTSKYCYKCGLALPEKVIFRGDMSGLVPAGFWRRFVSFIIDNIFVVVSALVISSIIITLIFSIFPDLAEDYALDEVSWEAILASADRPPTLIDWLTTLGGFLYTVAYWTVAVAWKGRTVGKLMLGIKVVRTDGSRVSYLRAFARWWAYLICLPITLGFGFLIIGLNAQKRGLHDFICDTMVVRI